MEGASETADLGRSPSGVETPIFPSFLFLLPLTYIAFDTEREEGKKSDEREIERNLTSRIQL